MTARFIVATVFDGIASVPDTSVDLVLTSPPYVALRSYLPADHPTKAKEIGSEPTPGAFIDTMLDVVEALDRVLAPHGSICIELGDSFAGSGGAGGDYHLNGLREGQEKFSGSAYRARSDTKYPKVQDARSTGGGITNLHGKVQPGGRGWPLDKSLAMVPESFRWALAYGRNPFTGRETAPWRVRNVVRHFRPNPPVGALGDKFRPATSDWVVATKSRTRLFDLDAVRTEHKSNPAGYTGNGYTKGAPEGIVGNGSMPGNLAGAPPLDWWADDDLEWRDAAGFVEPTFPYKGAHFATFSPSVVARLIKPMCPQRVCRTCGEPSRRIVDLAPSGITSEARAAREFQLGAGATGTRHQETRAVLAETWSTCAHDDWRPGLVLDPFAGSGTTIQVATGHGYDAVGIDLDARNADLARERCGMFLEVRELAREATP